MAGRWFAVGILTLLGIPMLAPPVIGDWETDTWISNVIGPERLENGDEFGCHGYEGVNTIEENWVIEACREYLTELTASSRWGMEPISFGISGDFLDQKTADSIVDSGFLIVGDSLEDVPDGLVHFFRNGASLEKGVADSELVESAAEDTLVSIHWRARIDDLRVREDSDFIAWLEDQDVWFTTWGEWHLHQVAGLSTHVSVDGSTLNSVSNSTDRWSVPGSVSITFNQDFNGSIISVHDPSFGEYPLIDSDERKLTHGWRKTAGGMILTQPPGVSVTIELDNTPESTLVSPLSTFNGLHHAVTVVGHHTSNLFRWASNFQDSELVFTWLLERPMKEGIGWIIPAVAVAVLVAVPVTITHILKKDQSMKFNDQES